MESLAIDITPSADLTSSMACTILKLAGRGNLQGAATLLNQLIAQRAV